MKTLLLCALAIALTIAGCTTPESEQVASASSVPLSNTNWRLTQLGGQEIANPAGPSAMSLKLEAQNSRLTGFAGCNRMFGAYSLNGDQLKFDEVGATKMACLDQARMKVEQDFFQALSTVSGWKITGNILQLLDAGGAPVATFAAAEG